MARPLAAAGSPLAADSLTVPRSPDDVTGADAMSVVVRTKNQPPPRTSSIGWVPTVAATSDRRWSRPSGPMLYEETVPDPALARYARVPASLTVSQHAAAWDSPTSLMGCSAPAPPTRYEVAALTPPAPPPASETMASPPALNPKPYGAVPVETVCRKPESLPVEVTLNVSMLLLTFSVTIT